MRAIVLILLLTACGAKDERPTLLPVAVTCVTDENTPAHPPAMPPLTGNAQEDVVTVTVQALRWRLYSAQLEALLEACR